MTYAVSLESNGKRALVESSKIPADTTHVKSQVLSQRLRSVAQQLGLVNFPATAAVATDLGAASTTLTLLP